MESISDFMRNDHDRLDTILVAFRDEADPDRAREIFDRFAAGLRAHIVWEEELLFPPFEQKTGMRDSGPTAVMREEHARIQACLDDIALGIGSEDARKAIAPLLDVLSPHNEKEEAILYPWLDQTLTESETRAVFARMRP